MTQFAPEVVIAGLSGWDRLWRSGNTSDSSRRSTHTVATLGRTSSSGVKGGRTPRDTRDVIVTHYGGPDALRVVEEECPEPKDGELRVRVRAAGVSLPDVMAREGVHPETPPVPFTPGWDLVGVVDRLGDGVSGIELG